MSAPDKISHGESASVDFRWFLVGLASSFPDLAASATSNDSISHKVKLSTSFSCTVEESSLATSDISSVPSPGCKIFRIPQPDAMKGERQHATTALEELSTDAALNTVGLEDQLLVFRHRGKFHAIDHKCPHRSYPLSRGSVYDIEDFGIVLSAGIVCPKHGWAFDLFTGESDRGAYELVVWEMKLDEEGHVWVRRR